MDHQHHRHFASGIWGAAKYGLELAPYVQIAAGGAFLLQRFNLSGDTASFSKSHLNGGLVTKYTASIWYAPIALVFANLTLVR